MRETLDAILKWLVDSQELVEIDASNEDGFGSDPGTLEEEKAANGWASLFAYLYFGFLEAKGELPDRVETPGSWWFPDYETMATKDVRDEINFPNIVGVLTALRRKDRVTLEVFKRYRKRLMDHPWVQKLRFDLVGQAGIRRGSSESEQLTAVRDAIKIIAEEARKQADGYYTPVPIRRRRRYNEPFSDLKLLAELIALEKQVEEQTGEHIVQNPEMSDDFIEIYRQGTGRRDYDGSRFINQSNRPFHRPPRDNRRRR